MGKEYQIIGKKKVEFDNKSECTNSDVGLKQIIIDFQITSVKESVHNDN
jgi:hypothetical protein